MEKTTIQPWGDLWRICIIKARTIIKNKFFWKFWTNQAHTYPKPFTIRRIVRFECCSLSLNFGDPLGLDKRVHAIFLRPYAISNTIKCIDYFKIKLEYLVPLLLLYSSTLERVSFSAHAQRTRPYTTNVYKEKAHSFWCGTL